MEISKRYSLIDAIRGFAIINMVAYHFLFDLFVIFGFNSGWITKTSTFVWEQFICFTFIIISGVSFNFSKHPCKKGLLLNAIGFIITAVTVIAVEEQAIWFGILNFLGCAILILQPLKAYNQFFVKQKLPPLLGTVISAILFLILYGVPKGYLGIYTVKLFDLPDFLYGCKYLAFLGFPSADFSSADFFPIIPWIFLFLTGYFIWQLIKSFNIDGIFKVKIPVLDFIGRHSLVIYGLHQPLALLLSFCIYSWLS